MNIVEESACSVVEVFTIWRFEPNRLCPVKRREAPNKEFSRANKFQVIFLKILHVSTEWQVAMGDKTQRG